jgi:FtsP/CotA-like multicopper oxidase with cupredoxin domain
VVTITLTNKLLVNTSMVFPGMTGAAVAANPTAPVPGLLAMEVPPGGTVDYTFTASKPGTFYYQSGTNPDIQVGMGLHGAIVVYPTDDVTGCGVGQFRAYNDADSCYDHEYLFLLNEMDHRMNNTIADGLPWDNTEFHPVYWFINGRNGPDTLSPPFVPWLPAQPYNSLPRTHPGEKVLMRFIGMGRDLHPFHPHGNFINVIARDAMLLSEGGPGTGADLARNAFTLTVAPGQTYDALFTWTGEKLGWDIYGTGAAHLAQGCDSGIDGKFHSVPTDPNFYEYCADHGVEVPAPIPHREDVTFGALWSGTHLMGELGPLPPGEGGFNPAGAFTFIWHSHSEKEIVNNDVFPGGMLTFVLVEPPGTSIP